MLKDEFTLEPICDACQCSSDLKLLTITKTVVSTISKIVIFIAKNRDGTFAFHNHKRKDINFGSEFYWTWMYNAKKSTKRRFEAIIALVMLQKIAAKS